MQAVYAGLRGYGAQAPVVQRPLHADLSWSPPTCHSAYFHDVVRQRTSIPRARGNSAEDQGLQPGPSPARNVEQGSPHARPRFDSSPSNGTPTANAGTRNQTLQLPPFLRITAEDERLASEEGHFLRRLRHARLVDDAGNVTKQGRVLIPPMAAEYLHLTINKMLSMNRRYQTVLAVLRDVGNYMSVVNLVTAMHRLGRLVRRIRNPALAERVLSHPQYQYLIRRADDAVEHMQPRGVANFLWGMAALGDQRHTKVALKCVRRLENMSPSELKTQEISNVVWSLATMDLHLPKIMNAMLDEACDRIDECVPQALSNMIWGCATLRHHHPRFIEAVAKSAIPRLHTFQSQTLANTLWAYSVLGEFPEELFMKAGDEVVRRLQYRRRSDGDSAEDASSEDETSSGNAGSDTKATSQRFSRTRSTPIDCATAGRFADQFYDSFNNADDGTSDLSSSEDGFIYEAATIHTSSQGSPSGGSALERSASPSLSSLSYSQSSRDSIYDFRGQEISNILISYARGCILHPQLLKTLERELCRAARGVVDVRVERLQDFTSQALANTLWAFASLRWYPARLLPLVTEAMGHIVHCMRAQELTNSLWSYARFAYFPGKMMASFLSAVESRLGEFEGQGCTNSLWALAVLKATHSAAFVGLLQRYIVLEQDDFSFGEMQYNQVLQAVLLAQFEARGGRVAWRPEIDLPEDVVDRALEAWASQQFNTQLSGFHLDVSEGLTRLGVSHLIEHVVAGNLLSVDIAVVDNGRRIGIEVDGPYHFPVNARTPLGHTMIRRRLLRAAGWTVISIPWYDWFRLKSWEERLEYLAMQLAKADDTFAPQLRTAVRELLSTDFAPGPGLDTSRKTEDAGDESEVNGQHRGDMLPQPSPEDGEDGPVLQSYYSLNTKTNAEVENGLMEVLSRQHVHLTIGALRRLENMGLQEILDALEARRRPNGGKSFKGSWNRRPPMNRFDNAGDQTYVASMWIPSDEVDGQGGEKPELLPKPPRQVFAGKLNTRNPGADRFARTSAARSLYQSVTNAQSSMMWDEECETQSAQDVVSSLDGDDQTELSPRSYGIAEEYSAVQVANEDGQGVIERLLRRQNSAKDDVEGQ